MATDLPKVISGSSAPPPGGGGLSLWDRRDVKCYKLDFFFLLTVVLIGKVLILRAIRYRRVWGIVSFLLLAAGYLATPAISYVFGLISDSQVNNDVTKMWAVFLVVLDGTADTTAAFSLEDNESTRKRFLWDKMLPSIWLLWLLLSSLKSNTFWIPIIILWMLFILKLREKKTALIYACRSRVGLDRVATVCIEYMRVDSKTPNNNGGDHTSTMQDYRYLVGLKQVLKHVVAPMYPPVHEKNLTPDKLATIDKIWDCEGMVLSPAVDTDGHLKDTCLSFALFWRLLPRFADYDPPKASNDKGWRFVSEMLLAKDQDYGRVFRVLEVELQFARDYFYTTYFAVYRSGVQFLFVRVIVLSFYLQVAFITLGAIKERKKSAVDDIDHLQLSITQVLLYTLIFVETFHILNMITSRWNKVKWVCSYVQDRWWESRVGRIKEWLLCKLCHQPPFTPFFSRWHRKIRQYDLFKCYKHTPIQLRLRWLLEGYMELPMIGQKEIAPINLSNHVREAVLVSLRTNGPKLSNGLSSLKRNNVGETFSWACNNTEVTRIILVWHIATCMCEKQSSEKKGFFKARSPLKDDPDFLVATSLSKYCAYLVAFVPKLLPDHVYMAQWIFEQAVSNARVEFELKGIFKRLFLFIKRLICGEEKLELEVALEAGKKGSLNKEENIVKMGALLAKQLKRLDDEKVMWKVLADFWAELILFLAPSNQSNEHAKHLINGGEFITHLWALLSHAGIIGRGDLDEKEEEDY